MVERLGLRRACSFGARRDLGDLLNALDLFVMPSLWEGLPLSMVLAMGARLPVVATASPAFRGRRTASPACSSRRRIRRRSARRWRVWCRTRRSGGELGQAASAFVRPRFGVDGYVTAGHGPLRSLSERGLA